MRGLELIVCKEAPLTAWCTASIDSRLVVDASLCEKVEHLSNTDLIYGLTGYTKHPAAGTLSHNPANASPVVVFADDLK